MAKRRISSVDLSWLILDGLGAPTKRGARVPLAVIPDSKLGWRVVIAVNSRRRMTADDEQRLAAVQKKLRSEYDLKD